jgi:hypothetical protein
MLALKYFVMIAASVYFCLAAALVTYDICMAASLRRMLHPSAQSKKLGRQQKPSLQDSRPTPLWVARYASLVKRA